jgi:hypothetical protein
MIAAVRNLALQIKSTEAYPQREALQEKIVRRLDLLEERLKSAAEDRGRKGGSKTAERGPDYFRQIAAMRKTRGGGRPPKESS